MLAHSVLAASYIGHNVSLVALSAIWKLTTLPITDQLVHDCDSTVDGVDIVRVINDYRPVFKHLTLL